MSNEPGEEQALIDCARLGDEAALEGRSDTERSNVTLPVAAGCSDVDGDAGQDIAPVEVYGVAMPNHA